MDGGRRHGICRRAAGATAVRYRGSDEQGHWEWDWDWGQRAPQEELRRNRAEQGRAGGYSIGNGQGARGWQQQQQQQQGAMNKEQGARSHAMSSRSYGDPHPAYLIITGSFVWNCPGLSSTG